MTNTILEVSAMMKVRKGKLEGFKKQAAEIIRLAKEKDTKTIRYDWFLSKDETECEVREVYESSEGLIEHRMHIAEALKKLFSEFAEGHAVKIYGKLSPQLQQMIDSLKDVDVKQYSFLKGLESEVTPEWQSLKV
jgi:quinol monooxygenase YgiN